MGVSILLCGASSNGSLTRTLVLLLLLCLLLLLELIVGLVLICRGIVVLVVVVLVGVVSGFTLPIGIVLEALELLFMFLLLLFHEDCSVAMVVDEDDDVLEGRDKFLVVGC